MPIYDYRLYLDPKILEVGYLTYYLLETNFSFMFLFFLLLFLSTPVEFLKEEIKPWMAMETYYYGKSGLKT